MAGLLGEIFSAGNVAKRKLTDLLGNPLLSAQQFVGNINDRSRALNELTAAAAREGIDYGPASQQLGGLMAEGYNPMGLTVFHGSPAKFNKFDRTKIGSGEGAQAYGYGHYVAESPDVARRYQMGLTQAKGEEVLYKNKPLTDLYSQIENKSMKLSGKAADIENQKLQMVEHMMLDKPPQELIPYAKETGFDKSVIDWLEKDVAKNTQIPGAFYEIDLPDEQIAKMLNWDKPLSQQPKEVQSWLKDPYNAYREQLTAKDVGGQEPTGGLIVNRLQQLMSEGKKADAFTNAANFGAPNASRELLDYGVPGIRYMDEASRGQGQGTSNFVVFPGNEDLLTIQKRNNEVIAPTSLLESAAKNFETAVTDASEIFGQGAKRIKYTDPNSGGVIDVLQRPDGTASVLGLEVPEAMRGQGVGQSLQSQVMQDFPEMMGQVSSKAAAKTAYRLGRRPPYEPKATLDDVYKLMDENSSVNLISPNMQKRLMPELNQSVYPQEEVLRLAQQRAALPVEQGGLDLPVDNTPEMRAAAMSFDLPAYHTSRTGIDTNILDSGKYAMAPFDSIGTHFGTKEAALDRFNRTVGTTDQIKGSSYPVLLRSDRPYYDASGNIYTEDPLAMMLSAKSDYGNLPKSNANLRNEIFADNSIIPYINDVEAAGSVSYIAPPENIRSRFAAFDPFRKTAATAALMGVAAPDLLAQEVDYTLLPPEKKEELLRSLLGQ